MNITKSTLGALAFNDRETTYFDDTLKGFGVRVGKTSVSCIVMYRNAYGKQKKLTIAKTTQITPAQARDEAKRFLALVAKSKSAKKSPYPIRRGCFSPIRLNSGGQRGLR